MALGIECKLMPATLYAAIQQNLAALAKERVHPVLVLDEAHLMPDSSLGTLHVIANFEWDAEPVVSIVLIGLPELAERLKLRGERLDLGFETAGQRRSGQQRADEAGGRRRRARRVTPRTPIVAVGRNERHRRAALAGMWSCSRTR